MLLLEDLCIWIGDTAATMHMTPHAVGMVPNKDDNMKGLAITVGNGVQEITAMHGTIKGQMFNKNGIGVSTVIFNNVAYSPQMKYSLFSLSQLMDDDWKRMGDTKGIMMIKKGNKLVFDIKVRTNTGLVYCLYINCMSNKIACPSITHRRPWSINDAHEWLGHPGKDVKHKIVKGLNLNMQPGLGTCWACTMANAKQKNVVQFGLHEHSQVSGERLFLDLIGEFWTNALTLKFLISSIGKIRWQRQCASCSKPGETRV